MFATQDSRIPLSSENPPNSVTKNILPGIIKFVNPGLQIKVTFIQSLYKIQWSVIHSYDSREQTATETTSFKRSTD